jgi:transposase
MAAMTAGKSQSASGAFSRRLKARLGSPKAITATAYKLARIFYHLWTTRQSDHDTGASYYDQQYQHRKLKQLHQQAVALGFGLIERPPSTPLVEHVS